MRCGEVRVWCDGDDPARVDLRVRAVVVAPYLVEPHGAGDSWLLVEVAQVWPQMRIVDDPPQAALEVDRVYGVETDQGREQPPVSLDGLAAEQVTPAGEA